MGSPVDAALTPVILALSLSQREVWQDQRAWPGSAHLVIGGGGNVFGQLDVALCRQALNLLVAEQDALRLAPLIDGTQQLLPAFEPELELIDIGAATEPHQAMQQWWQDRLLEPLQFDGRPPWRFALLRAHAQLHGLVLRFHHVVMDGWGSSQVLRRWSEIYNQLHAGQSPLPLDAASYRQFIDESLRYAASPAFERDAAYWHSQIALLPPALIPRRLHSAPGLAAAQLAVLPIARLEYGLLVSRSVAQNVSAFNYFVAALALYFARASDRDQVLIGVPTLNRGGRKYLRTPGMFVGVLALGVTVAEDMTALGLVSAVGASMRRALRHPRYPLSALGRSLHVVRSARDSLFDVLLSYEQQDYEVRFGDARIVDSRQFFSGVARYALGVTVCEFHPEKDLELVLEGSSACFTLTQVERLGAHLWQLAQTLAANPNARLGSLPTMDVQQQHELVLARHAAVVRHGALPTWISQFEAHAAEHAQATALVWDGGRMDYATLDQRANDLAHRLAAFGAGRGAVVALAIARSPDLVVAVLAITKSGAAFLPLDPDAPVARLADIVRDSGALALLIREEGWERLAPLHERTLVISWQQALGAQVQTGPPATAVATDLAYVLFTSGSTGRPKGVMVEHAALSRRLAWLSRTYAVTQQDRSALATQLTFDPALIELCLPLVSGASVALAPSGRLRPELLAEFVIHHGVTIMAFVPSTLAGFLSAAGNRPELKLRVACCGGEVLSAQLAERYLRVTNARLFNLYGPTEACIFATAWECVDRPAEMALPVGCAVDDTFIYVLDRQRRPLPEGVAGEVYIGGEGVARGYLNQSALTAESFLADPFRLGPRMYRTGDRGWLDAHGQLHFLGRLDRQVKLRGYRIELGEIESALLSVEGVTQAAAKLVERDGRAAIHAWVATGSGHSPDSLQRVLGARLPDYMIPSVIRVLAMLPTSGAGKVDYDSLPEGIEPPTPALARAPANQLERDLLTLWEGVLEHRPISVTDNFFDIGGDSLAAISILAGAERLLERKLPLYLLTENPTVERMVAALDAQVRHPGVMVTFGATAAAVPLYLAASGHGDLLRFQTLAGALEGVCDLRMLQPPTAEPIRRITDLAAAYADRVQAQGGEPCFVAGFSVGGIAALETARLLAQRCAPVRALILIDTVYPRAIWGGTVLWRVFGWMVRHLGIGDLSLNGRRLGAMFNDPGLVAQVMAMRKYRAGAFDGPTILIKTQGLSRWDRMLFGPWSKHMKPNLTVRRVAGLHGSIFEARQVRELAALLSDIVRDPE